MGFNEVMTWIELLGVPCSGKTYYLNGFKNIAYKKKQVEFGLNAAKLLNIFYGICRIIYFGGFLLLFEIFFYINTKRVLLLLERMGRVENSVIIDEGVMQALWGMIYATNDQRMTLKIISKLLKISFFSGIKIIYIQTNIRVLLLRSKEREECTKGFIYKNGLGDIKRARNSMAVFLRMLRKNDIKVVLKNYEL